MADEVMDAVSAFQSFYAIRRDIEQRKERARQGLADIGEEGRAQQSHQTEQRLQMLEIAASMFSQGEGHVNELYPDDDEGRFVALNELFGQVMDPLMPPGATMEQWVGVQRAFVENPGFAANMVEAIRSSEGGNNQLQYSPRAVRDPRTGRGVYVAQGEEVGQEPFAEGLRQENTELRAQELDRRRDTDDPSYQGQRSRAQARGRTLGELDVEFVRTETRSQITTERIDRLLQNPERLASITGLPSIEKLQDGGFGSEGVISGSPAADTLADLNEIVSDTRAIATELQKPPVSDRDVEALSGSIANLDRQRTPQGLINALQRLRADIARTVANTRAVLDEPDEPRGPRIRNERRQPSNQPSEQPSGRRSGETLRERIARCARGDC